MANPTCTTASLLSDQPCFSPQVLDPHLNLAMQVFMLAKELQVNGGTNYTALLASTASGGLVAAANDLLERATPLQLMQAELTIYRNNATAAGAAGISSNIQTLMESIKCLKDVDDVMLQKMKLTLLCKLGYHADYPQ